LEEKRMRLQKRSFVVLYRTIKLYGLERDTLIRSLKTSLVVGTILGLINHGSAILARQFTPEQLISFFVTYLVPFSVATYGQIQGKRQRDQAQSRERALRGLSETRS
jgi:hypothetical protein